MSAPSSTHVEDTGSEDTGSEDTVFEDAVSEETGEVEVRRRAELTGAVGAAGCLVAVAWFVRAAFGGGLLDWALCAVLLAVGVVHLLAMVDARTPLLVADRLGVRVRRGSTWHGVPWDQVERVELSARRGLRDGSVALEVRGAAAPPPVALSLSTRVAGTDDLAAALRELAGDDVEVAELDLADETDLVDDVDEAADEAAEIEEVDDSDETGEVEAATPDRPQPTVTIVASSTPLPLRDLAGGARADVVLGAAALRLDHDETDDTGARGPRLPEARELRRDGHVDLVEDTVLWGDRVRPIARPGQAVDPLVIGEDPPRSVPDPIVGPELAAARTRLGLSVDQLAERTRIRPHVIESIEVDDFEPCGGDFYARGHLRTLSRVLGVDAAPLLADYDATYADAPIDARRVFETELATGAGGSIRGTRGGPNWSVLVAAVMTVVLVWSVARLVMDSPADITPPAPRLNSSGGIDNGSTGRGATVPVVLTAAGGGAQVIVRSGSPGRARRPARVHADRPARRGAAGADQLLRRRPARHRRRRRQGCPRRDRPGGPGHLRPVTSAGRRAGFATRIATRHTRQR